MDGKLPGPPGLMTLTGVALAGELPPVGASAGLSQAARHTLTEEWQSHLAHTYQASNTAIALAAGPPQGAGLARARWVPRLRGPRCRDVVGFGSTR